MLISCQPLSADTPMAFADAAALFIIFAEGHDCFLHCMTPASAFFATPLQRRLELFAGCQPPLPLQLSFRQIAHADYAAPPAVTLTRQIRFADIAFAIAAATPICFAAIFAAAASQALPSQLAIAATLPPPTPCASLIDAAATLRRR